jgi:hypothetical protein
MDEDLVQMCSKDPLIPTPQEVEEAAKKAMMELHQDTIKKMEESCRNILVEFHSKVTEISKSTELGEIKEIISDISTMDRKIMSLERDVDDLDRFDRHSFEQTIKAQEEEIESLREEIYVLRTESIRQQTIKETRP